MRFNDFIVEGKKYYVTDIKNNRIGLIHNIFSGDKSIYIDEDVSKEHKELIINEFEKLENEIYKIIENKQKEFSTFLEKNNFLSGMGSIGYKK